VITEETKAKIIEYFDNMKVAMNILNAIFHIVNDAYTIHSDLQCEQFEKMCTCIGKFWRKALKIYVPPKIHLLESHVGAVMWRLRCIGCFSEQSIERFHHLMVDFASKYRNARDPITKDRLAHNAVNRVTITQALVSDELKTMSSKTKQKKEAAVVDLANEILEICNQFDDSDANSM
jgi:uncharacterized protein (DUF488 family)